MDRVTAEDVVDVAGGSQVVEGVHQVFVHDEEGKGVAVVGIEGGGRIAEERDGGLMKMV